VREVSCQLPVAGCQFNANSIGNWQLAANFTLLLPIRLHLQILTKNKIVKPRELATGNWQPDANSIFM
jgi:hypothetical protein